MSDNAQELMVEITIALAYIRDKKISNLTMPLSNNIFTMDEVIAYLRILKLEANQEAIQELEKALADEAVINWILALQNRVSEDSMTEAAQILSALALEMANLELLDSIFSRQAVIDTLFADDFEDGVIDDGPRVEALPIELLETMASLVPLWKVRTLDMIAGLIEAKKAEITASQAK